MKALTYHGTKDVRVETVADPSLVASDDIILRVKARVPDRRGLRQRSFLPHGPDPRSEVPARAFESH